MMAALPIAIAIAAAQPHQLAAPTAPRPAAAAEKPPPRLEPLRPKRPTPAQRAMPGLY